MVWFGHYLWNRRAYFDSLLSVSALDVLALVLLVLFSWIVTAAQSGVLYRASEIRISFRDNLLLTVGSAFGSYLPMMAGTVVRFHYMKSIHGLRYARSVSMSWLRAILVAISTALFGLVGVFGLALTGRPTSVSLLLLLCGLLIVGIGVVFVRIPPRWLDRAPRAKNLRDFFDGLEVLRRERRHALWVFIYVVLQQLSLAARLAIAAKATGQPASLLLLCVLAPLANFVTFVSITPAALGLREAVMGYVTYATGASFGSGLFVGTVDRAVALAMVTVFGSASLVYLWAKIRRANERTGALERAVRPPLDRS